jgi:ABC-2 type transport system permease protein
MKATLAVAWATLLLYLRERTTIALTLLLTALMMVVFGTVGAHPDMKLEVAVWNQGGAAGQEFVSRVRAQERVHVVELASLDAVRSAVQHGTALAGVVLAPGFELGQGLQGVELVAADQPSDWSRLGLDLLTHALKDVVRPVAPPTLQGVGATRDRYIDFIFPGVLAMSIMQASFPVGLFLLDTRRRGVLRRFRLAPRSIAPFLFGLVASRLLITALNLAVLGAIAVGVFGVRIVGSWLDLAGVVLLGGGVFIAMGVLIATVAPSTESGAILIQLFSMTMSFLCGVFFKLEQVPGFLRWLPNLLPLTYLADMLRGVANMGTTLASDGTSLAVLAVWLIAPLVLSGLMFRRFLEGE